jgi:hypothetical protein
VAVAGAGIGVDVLGGDHVGDVVWWYWKRFDAW